MKHRKQAWGAGLAFALVVVGACAPELRELGDAAEAGAGGDGSNAGSGTVVPHGGSKTTGGGGAAPNAAGASQNNAGAPNEDCFSPTHNVELSRDPTAVGCICDTADQVCVGSEPGEPFWYGMLGCESGRWENVPPSCDVGCFSPTESPMLAIDTPEAGCACTNEPAECVRTAYEGRDWDVGLECVDGRWHSVEDGVCGDGRQAACRVDGVTYPHGARNIPSPFDECNHCSCDDGQLDCTIIECGDIECAEGTFQARRCLACGPADACLEVETGCLSGPGCESGVCDEGRCG